MTKKPSQAKLNRRAVLAAVQAQPGVLIDIAARTGLTEQHVRVALRSLVAANVVSVKKLPGTPPFYETWDAVVARLKARETSRTVNIRQRRAETGQVVA